MTKKKRDKLTHTVDASKWAKAREAERITYAEPPRLSWRDRENYKGTELHHRSMHNRIPSLPWGKADV